jgi:hypothetical protein
MTTATTTYPLIRDQWATTIQALVPAFLADRFQLFRERRDFREWAEENHGACMRAFQITRVDDREVPPVTDGSTEQHDAEAELVVAYPANLAEYWRGSARGERPLQDLEDVLDADAEQLNDAIGINGAASYLAGQSRCECVTTREYRGPVAFLVARLRVTFYRSV